MEVLLTFGIRESVRDFASVARRLQPCGACADRGTTYDIVEDIVSD
jgi:hypothetical protein